MTTVKNIYDYINSIAPYDTQEEWDNSGHLIGDFRQPVNRVVMALDATKDVCDFAIDVKADLVFTHHPLIFSGLKNIIAGTPAYKLAAGDIAYICAHTNFDKAECGINSNLAKLLELKNVEFVDETCVAVGELDAEMSVDDFAEFVADKLDCAGIRYTDTDKMIKRVAVGGGSCGEYIQQAREISDCFVTGELKYHEMLDSFEIGYPVISAGHFETENIPFLMLKEKLEAIFTDVEFIIAPRKNPILSI
ncbi:MAG: Nif3-like dinuclear metal center hexameric protein [Eubacterium sp.]